MKMYINSSILNQNTHLAMQLGKAAVSKIDKKLVLYSMLAIGVLALSPIASEQVYASTVTGATDVMSGAYTSVNNIMKGSLSKIIALTSLIFGLIGCVARFNVAAIGSCFGVGIAAGVGPGIIEGLVSAIF